MVQVPHVGDVQVAGGRRRLRLKGRVRARRGGEGQAGQDLRAGPPVEGREGRPFLRRRQTPLPDQRRQRAAHQQLFAVEGIRPSTAGWFVQTSTAPLNAGSRCTISAAVG